MYAALFYLAQMLRSVAFSAEPLPLEVAEGARIFKDGRGIERTLQADRKAIGWWWDSRVQRDVEDVIWVTPEMVSRWLGYRQAEERWQEGELQHRWNKLSDKLDGRLTFVVRLAALPRQDPLENGYNYLPKTDDLVNLKATFTYDGEHLNLDPVLLHVSQSRERSELFHSAWYRYVPFGEPFAGEFDHRLQPSEIPLGSNYRAYYLLQFDLPEDFYRAIKFELNLRTPGKQRNAHFSLWEETRP